MSIVIPRVVRHACGLLALGAAALSAQTVPATTGNPTGNPAPKPAPKKKRVDFSATLGFSQTNGNASALATNVSNKLKYTIAGWSFQQDLAFFYGEANS